MAAIKASRTKALIVCAIAWQYGLSPLFAQNATFRTLRYEEDYSGLKDDTLSGLDKVKYIPVGRGKSYLSLGGEVRYQYFRYKNAGWGKEPHDPDGFMLSRILNHADFHLNDRFRVFTQLQSSLTAGSDGANSAVDENPLDIHQLFFDLELYARHQHNLLFRAGRQEMSYGSQRLVSVREIPNNRQAFDALRLIFTRRQMRTDVLYSTYVNAKPGILDEPFFSKSSQLWGAYAVFGRVGIIPNIDAYYLGFRKHNAVFDDDAGTETRHSFGTRLWKKIGSLAYDLEAVYQLGALSGRQIKAWTISLHTSYRINNAWLTPVLGFKTELISGDRRYDDMQINTFNPLFPRGAYFGLASLIGPYNLQDLHPYLVFKITDKLTWSTDCDLFWRMSRQDGLYAVNGRLIQSGRNNTGKFIGSQLGSDLSVQANRFLNFRGEFYWFTPGRFLNRAQLSRHILMTGFTATVKY